MFNWFKNRIKGGGGNNCKYKFKQRKKDSWRNITTLLNQDGVPGGGTSSSSVNSPIFNMSEQSSNTSSSGGRRPHNFSVDSDNNSSAANRSSTESNKIGSATSSNTKHVRFQLSLDSTRAYLSFDSEGDIDTCSEKSDFEEENCNSQKINIKPRPLDSKKIDRLQNAFLNVKINNDSDGGSCSDANSGVNSNHSSEESGHTTNSSGLGSSIMDENENKILKPSVHTLSHSKSVKTTIQPQIRQVKLQRHKSTIGGHSSYNRRGSLKKSNSISYKMTSQNPNGNIDTKDQSDIRKLYEQRLKQFQQQYPSIDPSRQHLGRQIVGLNRINSNPTQHHINLVRTMSTNAKIKKSFKDERGTGLNNSVLYA